LERGKISYHFREVWKIIDSKVPKTLTKMGFSKKDMKEFERISKLDMLIQSGIIPVFHVSQHSISGFSTTFLSKLIINTPA